MVSLLLVDDDDDFRMMLRDSLALHGYHILEAANGDQALNLLRNEAIEIVIMDIIMPEKEGLETLRDIKKHHPKTKTIIMSGGSPRLDSELNLRAAILLGADFALKKPFWTDELVRIIRTMTDQKDPDERPE